MHVSMIDLKGKARHQNVPLTTRTLHDKISTLAAVRIVRLCKNLRGTKKEYTLSKQLLRSGTSIGANIAEALQATDYLTQAEFSSIFSDCRELEKLLTAIIKTTKE